MERLEDALQLVVGDTWAVIADAQGQPVTGGASRHLHGQAARETCRVLQHIRDRAFELRRIAIERWQPVAEGDVEALDRRGRAGRSGADYLLDRAPARSRLRPACLQA